MTGVHVKYFVKVFRIKLHGLAGLPYRYSYQLEEFLVRVSFKHRHFCHALSNAASKVRVRYGLRLNDNLIQFGLCKVICICLVENLVNLGSFLPLLLAKGRGLWECLILLLAWLRGLLINLLPQAELGDFQTLVLELRRYHLLLIIEVVIFVLDLVIIFLVSDCDWLRNVWSWRSHVR